MASKCLFEHCVCVVGLGGMKLLYMVTLKFFGYSWHQEWQSCLQPITPKYTKIVQLIKSYKQSQTISYPMNLITRNPSGSLFIDSCTESHLQLIETTCLTWFAYMMVMLFSPCLCLQRELRADRPSTYQGGGSFLYMGSAPPNVSIYYITNKWDGAFTISSLLIIY